MAKGNKKWKLVEKGKLRLIDLYFNHKPNTFGDMTNICGVNIWGNIDRFVIVGVGNSIWAATNEI
jgi:hypothetical protein